MERRIGRIIMWWHSTTIVPLNAPCVGNTVWPASTSSSGGSSLSLLSITTQDTRARASSDRPPRTRSSVTRQTGVRRCEPARTRVLKVRSRVRPRTINPRQRARALVVTLSYLCKLLILVTTIKPIYTQKARVLSFMRLIL